MVQIDEITDQMADAFIAEQERRQAAAAPAGANRGAALPPGHALLSGKTADEILKDLNKSPLFMTELEENDDLAALQALAYEGTPRENAEEFKEHGNERFKTKQFGDAKEFYTKGIDILAAQERARARGEKTYRTQKVTEADKPGDADVVEEKETEVEDDAEEIAKQRAVLESLYVNRAACQLELGNYRSCWMDCGFALRLNPKNLKAYYRSSRALLKVERITEADDACARGMAIDPENKALQAVARDILAAAERYDAKANREAERAAKEKRRAMLLKAALAARTIRTRETAQPPEMEDARMRLVPDEDDAASSLSFPAVFLYPVHLESDFIKAFNEQECVADHLAYILPVPWDEERAYTPDSVECYMETVKGGLVKVGKKAALLKVLSGGNVEVVDGIVRFYIVPASKAKTWIEEFKLKKAAEKK